jgi:hypothetical protein
VPTRVVAMLIQRGVSSAKQEAVLLPYILSQHLSMSYRVPCWRPEDAVALVRSGMAAAVVAAFNSKVVQQLAAEIGAAGNVIVVHPEPMVVEPPRRQLGTLGDLILRWWRRGRTVQEIALDIDGDTTDVRQILRRSGEDPGRSN